MDKACGTRKADEHGFGLCFRHNAFLGGGRRWVLGGSGLFHGNVAVLFLGHTGRPKFYQQPLFL